MIVKYQSIKADGDEQGAESIH